MHNKYRLTFRVFFVGGLLAFTQSLYAEDNKAFQALMNVTGGGGFGNVSDIGEPMDKLPMPKEPSITQAAHITEENDDDDDPDASLNETIRKEAFNKLLEKTFPLNPKEILTLHRELEKSKAAVAAPPFTPPHPVSSTIPIDLSPGSNAPVVRLAKGFVTSMVFVDSTGQPWPIADYTIGNAQDFTIQWDNKTNTLFVQSNKNYVHTNLALRMENLDAPIMMSFVTNQKEVDYRVDLQLQARGPNAVAPIVHNLPRVTPEYLVSALDGIPPNGSRQLKVNGINAEAWMFDGKMVIRTKYPLLSPAWSSTVSSVDGTRVYQVAPTPSILVSVDGNPVYANISGM